VLWWGFVDDLQYAEIFNSIDENTVRTVLLWNSGGQKHNQ